MKRVGNAVQAILSDGNLWCDLPRQLVAMPATNHMESTTRDAMLREWKYWVELMEDDGRKASGWKVYQQVVTQIQEN